MPSNIRLPDSGCEVSCLLSSTASVTLDKRETRDAVQHCAGRLSARMKGDPNQSARQHQLFLTHSYHNKIGTAKLSGLGTVSPSRGKRTVRAVEEQ
jgi:hypothetical protein